MKRFIALLITAVLFVTIFPAASFAGTTSDGAYDYEILGDSTVRLTKYNGQARSLKIDNIDGYTVTEIGAYAFSENNNLINIQLSNSITSIGESAFRNCANLTTVKLPASLESIGPWAFGGNAKLSAITFPTGLKYINYDAFNGCSSLKSVKLPDGLLTLGHGAFVVCDNLESISIPGTVQVLEESTFYGCPKLKTVIIGDGMQNIEYRVFAYCESLTTLAIPKSVTNIDYRLFSDTKTSWWNDPTNDAPKNLTIYCDEGSAAYNFAVSENLRWAPMSELAAGTRPSSTQKTIKAPTGVSAKPISINSIKLTWKAVSGAYGYEIQRSENNKKFVTVKTVKGTAYTDKNLGTGKKYFYRVRAYKMSGGKKVYGSLSKVTNATLKLSSPKSAKATALTGGFAKINWGSVAGASGYVVERSTNRNSGFKPVKTAVAKTFTDKKLKKGTTYYYRVRAFRNSNGKKVYGAYSAVFGVKAK